MSSSAKAIPSCSPASRSDLYLIKRTVNWLYGFSFEDDQYDAVLFAVDGGLPVCGQRSRGDDRRRWRATRIDPVGVAPE